MLETIEIKISGINGDWVEYKDVETGITGGSIALSNFPNFPERGEVYYVIQDVQFIKGVALKLR